MCIRDRDKPIDFISFAKTVAETLQGDCDDWAEFWYRLLQKKGYKRVYKIHIEFENSAHAGVVGKGKYFSNWNVFSINRKKLKKELEIIHKRKIIRYFLYKPWI